MPTGAAQLPSSAGTPRRAQGGPSRADRTYRRILIYSLRHPLPTLLIIGFLSATTVIPAKAVQTEGKKGNPSGDHYVEVDFPRSTSLREADEIMETLRVAVEPLRSPESIESITVWFDSRNGTLAFFLEPGMTAQREVFLESPFVFPNAGTQVVVPPFTALFPQAIAEMRGDEVPVTSPVFFHEERQQRVFVTGPRLFGRCLVPRRPRRLAFSRPLQRTELRMEVQQE